MTSGASSGFVWLSWPNERQGGAGWRDSGRDAGGAERRARAMPPPLPRPRRGVCPPGQCVLFGDWVLGLSDGLGLALRGHLGVAEWAV